jgi:membrane protein implicated in regulation of membrane protease activity
MDFATSHYWFIFSVILLLLEVSGVSGIGLLFGGIAAGVVGVLLETHILGDDSTMIQWGLWFFITTFIAVLLFKPMQKWRTSPKSQDGFSNMVGTTAKVAAGGLMIGRPGRVTWSGTLMNATIAEGSSQEAFFEGDIVQVVDVRGNQLLVTAIKQQQKEQEGVNL